MRAQKIEDPSMEDILSSIRKIISEDEKENGNNRSANNSPTAREQSPATQNQEPSGNSGPLTSAFLQNGDTSSNGLDDDPEQSISTQAIERAYQSETQKLNPTPQPQNPPVRPVQHHQPISNYQNPSDVGAQSSPAHSDRLQPSSAMEQKEKIENIHVPEQREAALLEVVEESKIEGSAQSFTEKPNPMIRPSLQTQPEQATEVANEAGAEQEAASRPVPEHASSAKREIPGFVESKPAAGEIRTRTARSAQSDDGELHPAIANAKSYMAVQEDEPKKPEPVQETSEQAQTPVFKESEPASVNVASEQLISPDSVERRAKEERRVHPMRRQADQTEQEFKQELMSPSASESVHVAFEQLKNMATENMEANVKEVLRPMLREWLDNNLPSMVERLVRDEIERVSRGD